MKPIEPGMRALLKDAAAKLTGAKKREFLAKTAVEYCAGSARKTETYFGWERETVALGLQELRSGIVCVSNHWKCGRRKTEARVEGLEAEIRALVEPESQADPQLRTTLAYTQVTAQGVYDALRAAGWSEAELPTVRTINAMLNRMGYRLRTVAKMDRPLGQPVSWPPGKPVTLDRVKLSRNREIPYSKMLGNAVEVSSTVVVRKRKRAFFAGA